MIAASLAVLLWAIGQGPEVYNSMGLMFLVLAMASIAVFLLGFIGGLYMWASAVNDAYVSAVVIGDGGDARRISMFHL